ncbi:MAG: HEPN domain-containing protein [Dysgonamonadaceae bacterium]|jgi:HEPN domain-containing protein|nr:HEPN domain-containing protein [Dysgonamonadaceae bacterium]
MINEEKVQLWMSKSDEDLSAAEYNLKGKYFLYFAFLCQQAIEKIFKAYYANLYGETPPYTHDLLLLSEKCKFLDSFTIEQRLFLESINRLYISTRYVEYKNNIIQMLTQKRCMELLEQTKTLQQWTKEKILSEK